MMRQDQPKPRRPLKLTLNAEALESRQLLTGGAGSIFAIIPGEITTPGGQTQIETRIEAGNFTIPSGRMVLGVDVAPAAESAVKPSVKAVTLQEGGQIRGLIRSVYSPFVTSAQVTPGTPTSAVLAPIKVNGGADSVAMKLTVDLAATDQTSGKLLAGYYLPGDTNDDGKVDATDLNIIRRSVGAVAGESAYNFDADSNRDGRITMMDLAIASMNQGVQTTIRPIVSATLDNVSDSGTPDRRTVYEHVWFNGEAAPGSVVTFKEVEGRAAEVSATAGADGKYQLQITLAEGENTFEVTAADRFGQTISGKIAPVTYLRPLVPVESPAPAVATPVTPPAPIPTPPADPVAERLAQLKERFPSMTQDQAENLRQMLARTPATQATPR